MPETYRQPVREQVLEALGQAQDSLHELDYEDVALSAAGLALVRRAAATARVMVARIATRARASRRRGAGSGQDRRGCWR